MKTVFNPIEIPETRADFYGMPLFRRELDFLAKEWNVNVQRHRIREMAKADQPKADFVLRFFVECGAMTYTLMQMPLREYKIDVTEVLDDMERPFADFVAEMYKFCQYYSRDWHSRDIQMFPIEDIDEHPNKVRALYKKLMDKKVQVFDWDE